MTYIDTGSRIVSFTLFNLLNWFTFSSRCQDKSLFTLRTDIIICIQFTIRYFLKRKSFTLIVFSQEMELLTFQTLKSVIEFNAIFNLNLLARGYSSCIYLLEIQLLNVLRDLFMRSIEGICGHKNILIQKIVFFTFFTGQIPISQTIILIWLSLTSLSGRM